MEWDLYIREMKRNQFKLPIRKKNDSSQFSNLNTEFIFARLSPVTFLFVLCPN